MKSVMQIDENDFEKIRQKSLMRKQKMKTYLKIYKGKYRQCELQFDTDMKSTIPFQEVLFRGGGLQY